MLTRLVLVGLVSTLAAAIGTAEAGTLRYTHKLKSLGLVCYISDKACWCSANAGQTSGKCGCAAPPDKAFWGTLKDASQIRASTKECKTL